MIRFPSSLQRRQHITSLASACFHQFRFSSASSLDEVPTSQEVLTAFNTLGITGSSLHELSRKGDSATSEQSVKKRFLELAKQQHPDVSKNSNTKTMSEINGAYKVLKNFFKAGGFPKFVSSSSASSSYSQTAGGAYYQTPYESQQQQSNYSDTGFYDNVNSEFFWAGFEDVIKNHPHFKNQNPNSFHNNNKKNRGTSSSSNSSSQHHQKFYTSGAPPGGNPFGRMFVDDEELRQAAGQAAAEGADFYYTEHDFGGPNGEDVSPEEAFEIFQRYQQHMHGSGFYGGGGPTSSPMGESFTYDDARTIRDADDFFAQQHFHPFQFEFVDFDEGEIPPGYHFHFDDQFHPGARRGGRKNNNNNRNYRGNTNHSSRKQQQQQQHQGKGGKKNNNGKPWQNPDQFFKDSFNHPNRNQHQHQKSSSSATAKNSAGVNLSPEEYEAILNMHADGQSFTFIANSLGLTEKQAITGFNIAKKKQREEERQQHKAKNHSDTSSSTSNTSSKSSSAEKPASSSFSSTTNKNNSTSTSAKQQNNKKEVFDVDDDAAEHDENEADSSQHFKSSAVKNDQKNNNSRNNNYKFVKIEDDDDEEIDDDAPDPWDPYDDGEYPQPFTGKPMHHHAMGRKLRNHGNNHNKQHHNQKQKQKWRNHSGGGGGGGNKKKFSSHGNKKRR